jgi:ribosome maturation factor RimP
VTLEDCQKASRAVSAALDVEDIVPARYSLEVSSPGLDRPLKTAEDFTRFAGELARVKTSEPIGGRANYFGTLKGMDGNDILMNVDGINYRIPLDKLAKARIEYKG